RSAQVRCASGRPRSCVRTRPARARRTIGRDHAISAILRPSSRGHHRSTREASMTATTPSASTLLGGRKLVQVALTSLDLERSKAFYRDLLGFKLLFEVPNMVFYQLGDLRLMVGKEAGFTPGGSVLYIDAPDIDTLSVEM